MCCSEFQLRARHIDGVNRRYRHRIGSWRVLFDFDGTVCVVTIEEVKKRNERTY